MSEIVRGYYDDNAEHEWQRLAQDKTEFALTQRALGEHLPPAPASVLDIGGGPGRYAIHLARLGYEVTLADISEAELGIARTKAQEAGVQLAQVVAADARNLAAFESDSFDAVLMLGPLYHLLEDADRRLALGEARRVLKPGGALFAAFIMRYAVLRFWAKYGPERVAADWERYKAHLVDGQVRDNFGFTDVYVERPQEVAPFVEGCGFQSIDLIGCEGIVSMIREKLDGLDGEDWERWMDVNYRLGKDPSTHGCNEHLLCVGRKT